MKVDLLTWCEQYVRSRDAMERKLKSLERKADTLVATYKDKVVTFIPLAVLDSTRAGTNENITLVTIQNQANFNALVSDFAVFAKNPFLTVMFINPSLNEKWSLKPAIHASVADKSSLKVGLQTLYQTVPPA